MADRRTSWRLSPRQRKVTLLVHIVSGIGWMGADIVLFLLLVTGLTTDDGAARSSALSPSWPPITWHDPSGERGGQ